jgi:excisionase family DNA binding protein
MDNLPEVLGIEQAAQFLQLGNDAIYKMLQKKELPGFKVRGKWRLSKTALTQYVIEKSNMYDVKPKKVSGGFENYSFR